MSAMPQFTPQSVYNAIMAQDGQPFYWFTVKGGHTTNRAKAIQSKIDALNGGFAAHRDPFTPKGKPGTIYVTDRYPADAEVMQTLKTITAKEAADYVKSILIYQNYYAINAKWLQPKDELQCTYTTSAPASK